MGRDSSETTTEISPYTEQEPFLWDSHRYYGFISGVGAGKTAVGVMRLALNAELWNRGSMGAIVAPSTRMIKNAIFPVMSEFGLRQRWDFTGFQAEEPGFHTPGGGRVVILSADNERTVERLANLNLSFWWLDEAKETPERARNVLKERLRVGNYRNGFITTTPKGYDHNYDFFVGDPQEEGTLEKHTHGEAVIFESENKLCIGEVPSWANPHTPEDYHEEMKDLPDEVRLQQAEGKFVQMGSGVYTKDMFDWIQPEKVADTVQPMIGVDPAVQADSKRAHDDDSDFWAVTLAYWYPNESELYVADTAQKRGMTLQEGVSFIQSIVNQVESPQVVVESNQSQRWLQQELADKGVNAIPVQTTRNKEEKLIDMSIPISNGTVKFIDWREDESEELPYQELRDQMLGFPESSHDDLMDSLNLIVDHAPTGTSIFGGEYNDRDLW